MIRECGTCSLCCKVLGIKELNKPRGEWCSNVKKGCGCVIHGTDELPRSCREFTCLWLERSEDGIPEDLKPDKVHAVLTWLMKGGVGVTVRVDPGYPLAHRDQPLEGFIDRVLARNVKVLVAVGDRYYQKLDGVWLELEKKREGDPALETVDMFEWKMT